jgi:type I restriction-modification system DNA methylase subunit
MTTRFTSALQGSLFSALRARLGRLGYRRELLAENYTFGDWFVAGSPERAVPIAAFGQFPLSYETACFSVVLASGRSGINLVQDVRALGAPFSFEVRQDKVICWIVGKTAHSTIQHAEFNLDNIDAVFAAYENDWLPLSVLRAKNVVLRQGDEQRVLFDDDLIPSLEQEIRHKLDPLLAKACALAKREYQNTTGNKPNSRQLFQLAFRLLAGKIFHDRSIGPFTGYSASSNPDLLLAEVAKYYGESMPRMLNKQTRMAAYTEIWSGIDLRNLSIDILTHIWTNTFVSDDIRKRLGIHSTPRGVAKYIVDRLRFEDIDEKDRVVVEPCCGSATFLVAALQRLRELLPSEMSGEARHRYFTRSLLGFEKEAFGIEISRLCLTLSDFPNPNHWRLFDGDVFGSRRQQLLKKLRTARVVLCNPPFEAFSQAEQSTLQPRSVQKPAELLRLVLDSLHVDGILGFVLPNTALDGNSYADIRGMLATRFASIEICELPPDVAFATAQHPTALVIAQQPRSQGTTVTVVSREVYKTDWDKFTRHFAISREDIATVPAADARARLQVPRLSAVWKYLANCRRLREVCSGVHRGIEWNIPLRKRASDGKWVETGNRHILVKARAQEGYKVGIAPQAKPFYSFELPETRFLCLKAEYERGRSFHRDWKAPKIILNSTRKGRHPWRLAAAPDLQGLVFYQTFTGLWPRDVRMTNAVAAVLNGPLANAYVATHEQRHNTNDTLEAIPVPEFSDSRIAQIDALVAEYSEVRAADFVGPRDMEAADRILRRIDSVVLLAYDLPPRLERRLLDFFNGYPRQVPFAFRDYFPPEFESCFSLYDYISPEFQQNTAGAVRDRFRDPSEQVLQSLQAAAEAFEIEQ